MPDIRFITLNPGHFHAALVQKEMYPQVAKQAHVYGPLGPDLLAHLQRVSGFNARAHDPTSWELEVHAGPDPIARLQGERPGNVVILAGRNSSKIDGIEAALAAGMHVLADKPWVLVPQDLPRLRQALDTARGQGLVAYDIMTERHEISSRLLRQIVQDEAIFGTIQPGSPQEPALLVESVHYLKKTVAGVPLRRPAWFFDPDQQGEGLSDVGTHSVDLAMWLLFPGQPLDAERDVSLLTAKSWPTLLTRADFQQLTGELDFPAGLQGWLQQDGFPYPGNTTLHYTLAGVHVEIGVRWELEAPPGSGDTHRIVCQGSQARAEIRQGRVEKYLPELYVFPNRAIAYPKVQRGLEHMEVLCPDVSLVDLGTHFRVSVPAALRAGHEAHFAKVTHQFLRYVLGQETMPAWEAPNMLAKYTVTTRGVELSRRPVR